MTGRIRAQIKQAKGSALILMVVLTSILAIVGVLFLMASRVESLSTSSLIDERNLNLAVDTIISKLSEELVLDTPGVAGQEYYDYPGQRDTWLASTEPYLKDSNNITKTSFYWGQISDLTGYISRSIPGVKNSWDTRNVRVKPSDRDVIKEYPEITLDNNGELEELLADADGDGIADSKWIELDDVMGSKGQKVYAAIRVIDNAGMLNVNTAYEFDPDRRDRCDGSKLHQINLNPLGWSATDDADAIFSVRSNSGVASPSDDELDEYERQGVWQMTDPCDDYTLFDISDELELRYRYLVSSPAIVRIENVWDDTLPYNDELGPTTGSPYVPKRPYDGNLLAWETRVTDPCDPEHDRRHLLTSYSIDRIIAADANGLDVTGMINLNFDPCSTAGQLDWINNDYNETSSWNTARNFYIRCSKCVDPNLRTATRRRMKRELAQLAVNLVDLRDRDTDVTSLNLTGLDDSNDFGVIGDANNFFGNDYVYGLEPFPVITQVAIRIDPNDPCNNPNYYAVELYNPFDSAIRLDNAILNFSLLVTDFNESSDPCDPNTFRATVLGQFPLFLASGFFLGLDEYIVVYNRLNPFIGMNPPVAVPFGQLILSSDYVTSIDPNGGPGIVDANFVNPHNIVISRRIRVRPDANEPNDLRLRNIYVDRQLIYRDWVRWDPNGEPRFYGRDFDMNDAYWWDVVYPRAVDDINGLHILGLADHANDVPSPRPAIDISIPYAPDKDLVTVGDIARIWTIGPTDFLSDPCDADNFDQLLFSGGLFDPNALPVISLEPNDLNDVNNTNNTRFEGFRDYERTVGEKLLFASIAWERGLRQDEDFIRLNLADPLYNTLFNYITVFDPRTDGIDNDGDDYGRRREIDTDELKIPGRINVNTAPYFVIAQLPWMTDDIAQAIVEYRDMKDKYSNRYSALSDELGSQLGYRRWRTYMRDDRDEPGFVSIGELNLVADGLTSQSIWQYGREPGPIGPRYYPDLTNEIYYPADDGAANDFEERDLIFARISNLVTVRSDVFTAYILVRLGTDGPQKRVMAILDRSDAYRNTDKVKVIAVHDVSYPK